MIVSAAGGEVPVYAMIDTAATSSAVLLETADQINAEIFQLPCRLSTFDSSVETERDFTNITVKPSLGRRLGLIGLQPRMNGTLCTSIVSTHIF